MKNSINQVYSFDIECLNGYFNVGLKDFTTKEVINLEVSDEFDDRKTIYKFFNTFKGYLISFNGIHYDCVVIKYFLKEWKSLSVLPKESFIECIRQFSNKAIHREDNFEYLKKYIYFEQTWNDIDLFLYWAKMLRISKKISLKSLGIQLGYPVVQELPYSINDKIENEKILNVREYNNIHDLGILDMLAEKMREDIKLRINIKKDYNLNCMSWDAIKIASEVLLQDYCAEKWQKGEVHTADLSEFIKQTRNLRFEKSTIPINNILCDFNPDFQLPIFQNLYGRILNSINDFSEELLVISNNTTIRLSYGIGGLHSINENEIYLSNNLKKIKTSDVRSLYPNLIINYKCIRFPEVLKRYIEIKDERIVAKERKNKVKDTFFKLILNGISGLLDQEYSWLYYPEGALRLRLIGQLILTKLVEVCLINNWQVISVNTDGIELILPVEEEQKYHTEVEKIEQYFNLQFEHEIYEKIVYTNVNNYICKTESGKLKKKGFYKTRDEIPLGDSVNELVVSKALEQYFINNIPIEEVICNPEKYELHIYDYCCSKKVSKHEYEIYHDGQKVQNLNRYYFSNPAPYLLKRKIAGKKVTGNFEHMHSGDPVLLFNKFEHKPWDDYKINYKHYIKKAREIIDALEIKQKQLTLFN